jgi:hypothetical protein
MRCQQRVANRREFYRKRIELRSAKLKFRISIPESSDFFVSHEKLRAFCGKDNPDDCLALSRKGIKNSLSLQLVASVNPIFSTFARQQTVLWSFSASWLLDFRTSKVCQRFREKASLTARQ